MFTKVQAGFWFSGEHGNVITKVIDREERTGLGKTVWVAFTHEGIRIGDHYKSRKAAQDALVVARN